MNEEIEFLARLLSEKYNTQLLNTVQLAKELGCTLNGLKNQRHEGRSPIPYVKIGASVRYSVLDIAKFICDNKVTNRNTNPEIGSICDDFNDIS